MNKPIEYQVALFNGDGTQAYESTSFLAADNLEAIEQAKRWIALLGCVSEDVWLQISLNGIGIKSLRPGDF